MTFLAFSLDFRIEIYINGGMDTIPLKYCLYARKSSESDEKQALSIDSQIHEMQKIAEQEWLVIVETVTESKSAKASGQRKGYLELLDGIREQKYNAILTWAPDRLSRNAGDLWSIVDMMDEGLLVQIRTHWSTFSNNPNEKFLLMILCSQAKLENDNRAKNVCRGMRRKCELGMRPGNTPIGYLVIRWKTSTEKSHVEIDPERAPFVKQMFEWVGYEGFSGRQVWDFIHTKWLRTRNGKKLTLSMVFRMLKSPFYYWEFEYPEGSGNWYKWDYEPLITKELYDEVRIRMKVPPKGVWWRKNFYFGRIFKCGCCGSGITGEEKVNKQWKRYIYYRCNRHGGKNTCNEKHIQEKDLIEGLVTLCDSMISYKPSLDKKLTKEVDKINGMQRMIHWDKSKDITKKEYLHFVFTSGSQMEKSEILRQFWEKLVMKDKMPQISN